MDSVDVLVAGSRRSFPNPVLISHAGRRVRFYDDLVRGRLVLVNFAYTRCQGNCSPSLGRLLRARSIVAARIGASPDLVTLTLDPRHDTPAILAGYVAERGSPAGWTCLTGSPERIERVRQFLGFTDPDPAVDRDRTQHAALVAMGDDRSGRWQVASTAAGAEQLALLALRIASRDRGA
jgi:protein SCO1